MLDSDRKWAISCYIPVANIVFCLLASVRCVKSEFCLFHSRQGILLFGTWIITLIFSAISKEVGLMVWGIVILMHGTGIYFSYHGEQFSIPVLGKFVNRIPKYYFYEKLTGKKHEEEKISDAETVSPVVPQASEVPKSEVPENKDVQN